GYKRRFRPVWASREPVTSWRPFTHGIGRALSEGGFEALWVHSYARLSNISEMLAARRRRIPVLLREEMSQSSAQRSALKQGLKRLGMAGLDRLVFVYHAT